MRKLLGTLLIILSTYSCGENPLTDSPDYVFTYIQEPASPNVDGVTNYTTTYTIKNKGDKDGKAPVVVKFYGSKYFYYDPNDFVDIVTDNPGIRLKAGQSYTGTITYMMPPGMFAKGYMVGRIIASENEADTYNNIASTGLMNVINGQVVTTPIVVDNLYHVYTINANDTQNLSFDCVTGHAYAVSWDDFYDGTIYLNTGADIFVTGMSQDRLTTYFNSVDSGFTAPAGISTNYTGLAYLDVTASGWAGDYSIKIRDLGVPPDLDITLVNGVYDNPSKTVTLTYEIRNNSATNSDGSCLSIAFWTNLGAPPAAADPADHYVSLCRVFDANVYTANVIVSTPVTVGTAYAYVDVYNTTIEGDETNNVSLGFGW